MSNFGVARVCDPVFAEACVHGSPPFLIVTKVVGKIQEGSPNVLCNDRQVARMGDSGMHRQCPGPNTFMITGGAKKTFVNNRPKARETDSTLHCGSITNPGTSGGTITDGLGSPNTFCEKP
jgi:uncharacterized Zn-binding protein involved in type VI secretion